MIKCEECKKLKPDEEIIERKKGECQYNNIGRGWVEGCDCGCNESGYHKSGRSTLQKDSTLCYDCDQKGEFSF